MTLDNSSDAVMIVFFFVFLSFKSFIFDNAYILDLQMLPINFLQTLHRIGIHFKKFLRLKYSVHVAL